MKDNHVPADGFVYTTRVAMRHTDAAGVIFFARYFELMHDAFEAFMESRGLPAPTILHETHYVLPVVQAECDYRAALRWGDPLRIMVTVEEVRRRSFTLRYRFLNAAGKLAGAGRTTQVSVHKDKGHAIPLPPELVRALGSPAGIAQEPK